MSLFHWCVHVSCVEVVVFTLGSAGYWHVSSLPEDAEYAEDPLVVVCAYGRAKLFPC